MNRNQFTFYKSFDDTFDILNDQQTLEYLKVLRDVQFLRVKIQDVSFKDATLTAIWKSTKHTLETSIKGYLDSQLGSKVKIPFFGCYDGYDGTKNPFDSPSIPPSVPPSVPPSLGGRMQDKGKEQGKEQSKDKEEEVEENPAIDAGVFQSVYEDYIKLSGKIKSSTSRIYAERAWAELTEEERNKAASSYKRYIELKTKENEKRDGFSDPKYIKDFHNYLKEKVFETVKEISPPLKLNKVGTDMYHFIDGNGKVWFEKHVFFNKDDKTWRLRDEYYLV